MRTVSAVLGTDKREIKHESFRNVRVYSLGFRDRVEVHEILPGIDLVWEQC